MMEEISNVWIANLWHQILRHSTQCHVHMQPKWNLMNNGKSWRSWNDFDNWKVFWKQSLINFCCPKHLWKLMFRSLLWQHQVRTSFRSGLQCCQKENFPNNLRTMHCWDSFGTEYSPGGDDDPTLPYSPQDTFKVSQIWWNFYRSMADWFLKF